jgi:hypothetical protein
MNSLWLASEEFAYNLNHIKNIQQHTVNFVTCQGIIDGGRSIGFDKANV